MTTQVDKDVRSGKRFGEKTSLIGLSECSARNIGPREVRSQRSEVRVRRTGRRRNASVVRSYLVKIALCHNWPSHIWNLAAVPISLAQHRATTALVESTLTAKGGAELGGVSGEVRRPAPSAARSGDLRRARAELGGVLVFQSSSEAAFGEEWLFLRRRPTWPRAARCHQAEAIGRRRLFCHKTRSHAPSATILDRHCVVYRSRPLAIRIRRTCACVTGSIPPLWAALLL